MRLADALHSSSLSDILDSFPDIGDSVQPKKRHVSPGARAAHAKLRASQGAAQSGYLNVPDGVGFVPNEDEGDTFERNEGSRRQELQYAEMDLLEQQRDGSVQLPAQKVVDTPPQSDVRSDHRISNGVASPRKDMTMTLIFKGTNGKNTHAIFSGAKGAIRIPLTAFENGVAPTELLIDDAVQAAPVKEKKVKLTKEERAALPKPTEAERIARAEAALAKRKAKLAAAGEEL